MNGEIHALARQRHSWPAYARPPLAALAAVVACAMLHAPPAHAQAAAPHRCGDPFKNHFGPWDYRTASKSDLKVVEEHHFTPRIEQLKKGERVLGDDINYILHVFPNHHRALIAMTRLAEKEKTDKPQKSGYTVECWYDRAIRFRPNDTVARVLFAQYLGSKKRLDEAMNQLSQATHHAKDNPISHFNIGLVYFDLGNFDRALAQAHKAMAMGLPRTELADLLKREGQWREPGA